MLKTFHSLCLFLVKKFYFYRGKVRKFRDAMSVVTMKPLGVDTKYLMNKHNSEKKNTNNLKCTFVSLFQNAASNFTPNFTKLGFY